MKLKHNKKRNVAFLYECLIRELTKSIIKQDSKKQSTITGILKEHFDNKSLLYKELELYRSLYETKGIDPYAAEKIVAEAKKEYAVLNKKKLFKEQTNLLNKINRLLSKNTYFNFIPNYKDLATIQQIFNSSVSVKTRVLMEHNLICGISNNLSERKEMEPVDNLAYKTFIEKFNEKYSDVLLKEQKELLRRYITSFDDNGVSLKSFVNEEIPRIRKQIKFSAGTIKEENTLKKINKVIEKLDSFKTKQVDTEMLQQILKIQNLAGELKK